MPNRTNGKLSVSGNVTAGANFDHNRLYDRHLENQHPISAITGLQEALDEKISTEAFDNYYTKSETDEQIESATQNLASKQWVYDQDYMKNSTLDLYRPAAQQDSIDSVIKSRITDIENKEAYWNKKQSAISDLDSIREGSELAKTAIQPSDLTTALSGYRTAVEQTAIDVTKQDKIADLAEVKAGAYLGATAVQPSTLAANYYNKSEVNNKIETEDANLKGFINNKLSLYRTQVDQNVIDDNIKNRITVIESKEASWDAKQDPISDLDTIRAGAALGATAIQEDYLTTNYYNKAETDAKITTATSDMATKTWVGNNFIDNEEIDNYYTKDEIDNHFVGGTGIVVGQGVNDTQITIAADTTTLATRVYADYQDNLIRSSVAEINAKIPEQATSENQLSVVSVSTEGTATDEVQYITINGVEKKLAGGSGDVTGVKGNNETDYRIGDVNITLDNIVTDADKEVLSATAVELNYSSGLTGNIQDQLDAKQATLTETQLSAANSGITTSKVAKYDAYATSKQDKLTAGTNVTITDGVISANSVIPAQPTTDGTYTLKCTVTGGVATYSWE